MSLKEVDRLKKDFHVEILKVYERAKSEVKYNATRFIRMYSEKGGYETAQILLHMSDVTGGFTEMWKRGRMDLTIECFVLKPKWRPLFTEEDLNIARNRLRKYGHEPAQCEEG